MVDPVVLAAFIGSVSRSFNLKNVVSNANGSALDVTPVTNKLGTNVNVQAKTIRKLGSFRKNHITLAVTRKVCPSLSIIFVPAYQELYARCSRRSSAWSCRFRPSIKHPLLPPRTVQKTEPKETYRATT
jgi:hypothetical protein